MSGLKDEEIRCRRLGHEVPFQYCLTQEGDTVCPLIRDCWWERMDIDAYLEERLSSETLQALRQPSPPAPRLGKIIALAMRARESDSAKET
ncbi:MAG: hypothetical protein RRC34_16430 [Lentisphaeria bacterium]|nr:hypothetical protein [Lentisphaeria bacterium]